MRITKQRVRPPHKPAPARGVRGVTPGAPLAPAALSAVTQTQDRGPARGNAVAVRAGATLPRTVTPAALAAFIASCADAQWFTGKGRAVERVDVAEHARVAVPGSDAAFELALLDVHYDDGGHDLFHVPLRIGADGALTDALLDAAFVRAMTAAARDDRTLHASGGGEVRARRTPGARLPADLDGVAVKPLGVPQSNVSIKVGDDVIFKAYRKPEPGVSIELEVTGHLTAQKYANTPHLLGTYSMDTRAGAMTIGMLFELVHGDGDGWKKALAALHEPGGPARFLEPAALLGTRIAEMHRALGAPVRDPAFAPQPITRADLRAWSTSIASELDDTIAAARGDNDALARELERVKPRLEALLARLRNVEPSGMKTRIHGDLHLGQVLSRDGDWVVLDFEGEPARTKEERRGFYTPLRDVAGMLRSFAYAEAEARHAGARGVPNGWAKEAGARFLAAYAQALDGAGLLPTSASAFDTLLAAVELEKALYEVRYELKSRPRLVGIPAARVLEIASGR